MNHLLPPPPAFGLPAKFQSWRPDQEAAFQLILDSPTRFVGLTMPTGSGKSLAYMAALALCQGRGVVLTANKGLQDQIGGDFGIFDLRGMKNYPCKALQPDGEFYGFAGIGSGLSDCEHGPCHAGLKCTLKEAGCEYYDRVRVGQTMPLLTNYALWLAQRKYGQGLGKVDLLVLDEAHQAADEVASAMTIRLDKWLLQAVGVDTVPSELGPIQTWKAWAAHHAHMLKRRQESMPMPQSNQDLKARRRLRQAERGLAALAEVEIGNWVPDHSAEAWVWEVVNPSQYTETLLFQGATKVVLLSATLRPKTLHLLGIDEATIWECPSRFPVARRPVWYIPTCQVDSKMKPEHWNAWGTRIDQILDQRPLKGIVQTVSYKRRDRLMVMTRHLARMVTHTNQPGDTAREVLKFKKAAGGPVMVSPALTHGWDFPYDQCRFQIITKLPFPDSQSKVFKARCEQDPEYMAYVTAQTLEQMVGRHVRAEDDWGETFLIDDHWKWFVNKHRKLMTNSFLEAVQQRLTLPPALKL